MTTPPDTVQAMGYTPKYGPAGDLPTSVKFYGTRFVEVKVSREMDHLIPKSIRTVEEEVFICRFIALQKNVKMPQDL